MKVINNTYKMLFWHVYVLSLLKDN